MKLYNWHKVEGVLPDSLPEGKLTETGVAEKRVGLVKKNGIVYAFSALCPHAGSNLCEGWLDAMGRVVCPNHAYRFDPANGRNTSGEGYKLMTYPVEIREGAIYVGLLAN